MVLVVSVVVLLARLMQVLDCGLTIIISLLLKVAVLV
jgi:hypothetical protein